MSKDTNLTQEQQQAVAAFVQADSVLTLAARALEEAFLPKIHELLGLDDLLGAQTLKNAMPDSVAKVFAMDALRQYTLKNKKGGA